MYENVIKTVLQKKATVLICCIFLITHKTWFKDQGYPHIPAPVRVPSRLKYQKLKFNKTNLLTPSSVLSFYFKITIMPESLKETHYIIS